MAQYLRPSSDITTTSVSAGTFASINTATANDSTFVIGTNNSTATYETLLSSISTPAAGTCTVRYRHTQGDHDTSPFAPASAGTGFNTITCEVYEGATQIASGAAETNTDAWVTKSFTFNSSSVTNWADVRLRFTITGNAGATQNRRTGAISWAEIETPDAPAAAQYDEAISILKTYQLTSFTFKDILTSLTLDQILQLSKVLNNRNVYINSTASDSGRQVHPYATWSNEEVILSNIDIQGLSGNSFYFKVVNLEGLESNWYGPITINGGSQILGDSISLNKSLNTVYNRLSILSSIVSLSNSLSTSYSTSSSSVINALISLTHNFAQQNSSIQSISTILNIVKNIQLNNIDAASLLFETLDLSNLFVINVDNKSIFINTSPSDVGRIAHPYISWSDTAIELGSISKQGFEGYIYYFKVSNNGETDWYGPVVINEVHNAVLQLVSNFDIISTIVQLGTINELINLNKEYSINTYTLAVLRGFIELAHHLQFYILASDLSSINAFIDITKNLNLSIDTQALLNALVVMLQNNSITMAQLNAVLNATMQLAPNYTTLTNSTEPPVFWQVRTFKIKIGE